MPIDLSQLNDAQRHAAEHIDGPLLVLAGAGSGKTRVITYRTALLVERGIDPKRILVVTFTNKAAAEMRERILKMVPERPGRALTLSTFHAFGARLLRENADRVGLRPHFTIFDYSDQLRVVKTLLEDLGLKRSGAKPDDLLRIISLAKREGKSPANLHEMRFSPLLPHAQRMFNAFGETMRALNGVDFDDLLCLPLQLCREHEDVRELVSRRFQQVMVDEYQDTNAIQLELLKLVAGHGNVMAVGDDDQSIYGFRGAVSNNISDFSRQFPGAQTVKLEQNYRSTQTILDAANSVIAHNEGRYEKTLWSAKGSGVATRYITSRDERSEAQFVIDDLKSQHENEGVSYSDCAILYRINPQARPFEEGLKLARIPYKVMGSTELFDRAEVRDWLAYLSAIHNPWDDIQIRRILNVPRRRIGPAAMTRLEEAAKQNKSSLSTVLWRATEIQSLSNEARAGISAFTSLIDQHRPLLERARGRELSVVADEFFKATGLIEYLRGTEPTVAAAQTRIGIIKTLIEGMHSNESDTLGSYLTRVRLDSRASDGKTKGETGVLLLTFHSAKGLEFNNVYMVGFEQGLLPHRKSVERPSQIAEERRLCYVGMTRAMNRLTITGARTRTRRGERIPRRPSAFLEEIPEELLESESSNEAVDDPGRERNRHYLAMIREMLGSKEGEE